MNGLLTMRRSSPNLVMSHDSGGGSALFITVDRRQNPGIAQQFSQTREFCFAGRLEIRLNGLPFVMVMLNPPWSRLPGLCQWAVHRRGPAP